MFFNGFLLKNANRKVARNMGFYQKPTPKNSNGVFGVPFFISVSLWIFVPTIKKNVRTKFRNRNAARKGLSVLVFWLFLIVLGDTLPEGRGGKG